MTVLERLTDFILSVAPHKALIEAFRQFAKEVMAVRLPLESLLDLFGKAQGSRRWLRMADRGGAGPGDKGT